MKNKERKETHLKGCYTENYIGDHKDKYLANYKKGMCPVCTILVPDNRITCSSECRKVYRRCYITHEKNSWNNKRL